MTPLLQMPRFRSDEALLLWLHLVVFWMLFNYLAPGDGIAERGVAQAGTQSVEGDDQRRYSVRWRWVLGRSVALAMLVFLLSASVGCAALTLSSLLLPLLRGWKVVALRANPAPFSHILSNLARKLIAEWEITINALFIAGSAVIVAGGDYHLRVIVCEFQIPVRHVSAAIGVCAAIIFVGNGGTYVVRGILDKGEIRPPVKDSGEKPLASGSSTPKASVPEEANADKGTGAGKIDEATYNHGATIGVLERLITIGLVLYGSYESLGFLYAAKGLVRGKELEDRRFTEYFLVGTLTSSLLGIAAGLLLLYLFWQLGIGIPVKGS